MSATVLHRIDPGKRMSRFYRLDVQPDLFGQWCFIREWGRIGRRGQVMTFSFSTKAEAVVARDTLLRAKERRG